MKLTRIYVPDDAREKETQKKAICQTDGTQTCRVNGDLGSHSEEPRLKPPLFRASNSKIPCSNKSNQVIRDKLFSALDSEYSDSYENSGAVLFPQKG